MKPKTLNPTTLKKFIKNFKIDKPDWSSLPAGFPDCDLTGLDSSEVGKFNAIRTVWQLSQPPRPKARSRVWEDPKGYQYLAVWQNAALLRVLVRKWTTGCLPRSEYRLKAQMDDEARSVKRNIEEGWKRPTSSEYLQFLGYSQGSLEELRGDIRDCKTDGFLPSKPLPTLKDKGFNLRVRKGPFKGGAKGEPTEPGHPYYQPLKTLDSKTLTYEKLMELANKTDYLLRRLVESLEKKLDSDKKGYQIEKARLRQKATGRGRS